MVHHVARAHGIVNYDTDVLARLTRIEDKVDAVKDAHADLRVHVERRSALWGGITGLIASITAALVGQR